MWGEFIPIKDAPSPPNILATFVLSIFSSPQAPTSPTFTTGRLNHLSLSDYLQQPSCKSSPGLFLRGRFTLQEWARHQHQQPRASALSLSSSADSSCGTSHPADSHSSLWLTTDQQDDGFNSLGIQELSSSSSSSSSCTPYSLPLSSFDFYSAVPQQLDDLGYDIGTSGSDDLTNTTCSTGLPDILHVSVPGLDIDLSTVDLPTDSQLLGLSDDTLTYPDLSLPMFDPKISFDHSTLYNHSSPSSNSTTTAVLTHPSSTPTFSLLDDGSLVCNDTTSLFPSHYHDHHSSITPTPLSGTSSSQTQTQSANLHPGLSPPAKTSQTKGSKRGRPTASEASDRDASPVDADIIVKRQRNNIAAKKYRQKKIDRIEELEAEVEDIKKERDELRIQLAKREAETAALREMLKMATKQNQQ